IVFTWYGALIASIVVSFPLMYQSAAAAFSQYDPSLENAALTLGKSKWKVFWTISFPLAWPGLLAGLVLAFARGLGEFGRSEEHTSELQSRFDLVCRLLLEKKKVDMDTV